MTVKEAKIKVQRLRLKGRILELRCENIGFEERFKPYHDPINGRFTTSDGGGMGSVLYSKGGKSSYVVSSDLFSKKEPEVKSGREHFAYRLELIAAKSQGGRYVYETQVNDWKTPDGNKNRTYFAIVERHPNPKVSKHYAKKDYGYYDNIKKEYVPGKGDLNKSYTFGGNYKFE